jgi:phage baseplate assembly protein W
MASISVKFPFENTLKGGVFRSNTTTEQSIKSSLIALLTLKRGQRPMDNELYSPLYDYIMEPMDEITREGIKEDLRIKLIEYMPEISVSDIQVAFDEENNRIEVNIVYTIPAISRNAENSVSVAVAQDF